MSLFKPKGKSVRLDESLVPLLERLRQALERAEIDERQVVPDINDATVVAFSMRAACLLLTPRYALVDRDKYASRVDRELVMGMGMPAFASRSEAERLAMLDLILAKSAEFSGFHSTSPLMAAKTEGGKPS